MSFRGKKILVTGGAGFIGSHVVDRLLDEGASVIAIDNFDPFYNGKERNIQHNFGREGFHLIRGDILDYDLVSSLVKRVDIIFHEAAQAGVRYCNTNPLKAHQVNATGTLNVLLAAKQEGSKRIVYASSSSVYGDVKYLPMGEDHPTNPISPYGASKLAGEMHCLVFNHVYGLPVVCLRYFSVYGPRGRPDQVIYKFAEAVAEGRSPTIFGNGSQTRDFTFISDIVDATLLAAEADSLVGMVFNVGAGSRVAIKDLVGRVISKCNSDVEPIFIDSQQGDLADTEADSTKARRVLGWKPTVNLDDGLSLFLDWFREFRS